MRIGSLAVGGLRGASFYGRNNSTISSGNRGKYLAVDYPVLDPAGVAGRFEAGHTGSGANDVSIAGAFAATAQQ